MNASSTSRTTLMTRDAPTGAFPASGSHSHMPPFYFVTSLPRKPWE